MSNYYPDEVQPKPMPVVILNGPPNSGKDALAKLLADMGFAIRLEMKQCLFSVALQASGISEPAWFSRYNDKVLKEEPWHLLGGLSQRQFLIKISEDWMKPVFGQGVFGERMADEAQHMIWKTKGKVPIVFTDGGFEEELNAMVNKLGIDNVLLVRLHRDGTSFKGDSRNYLRSIKHTVDLYNNSTLEDAAFKLSQAIHQCHQS